MSLRLQLHLILATLIAGFTTLLVVEQVEDTRRSVREEVEAGLLDQLKQLGIGIRLDAGTGAGLGRGSLSAVATAGTPAAPIATRAVRKRRREAVA